MGMQNGNLDQVRAALQRDLQRGDIVDHAHFNPLSAEIVPTVSPCWHVIEAHPNHERSVAAHLIARRFGVFVPETEEDIIRRGRKVHVTRLMFTSYVFVFVWDINRHWSRLGSIPGVMRIMQRPDSASPIGNAVVISDYLINKVRAVENSKRPLPPIMVDEVAYLSKKKRGRWRKDRKTKREIEIQPNDIVAVRSWSAFEDALLTLDVEGRNQALEKALSLPS